MRKQVKSWTKSAAAVRQNSGKSGRDKNPEGLLVLEDGSVHQGYSFGSNRSCSGEVVFTTNMVGYPESMTDPSFAGQILNLTFPMIGNYGVPGAEKDAIGLAKHFESRRIWCEALLISDYCHKHSHWNAEKSLSEWMKKDDVPGLYGIDTRAITKKIREEGSMLGKIIIDRQDIDFTDINKENLVAKVSTKEVNVYNPNGKIHVVAVDCGMKSNIVRCLVERGAKVTVVPYDHDFRGMEYDGLFLSNGPGDPAMCGSTVEHIKTALQGDKPIFGICLGNQLLARAAGFTTYKLRYGNRGQNQPVVDMLTQKAYITPQNHGFAVDHSNLPRDWRPYFINANDGSNEGVIHSSKPFFSVQFHPEARGGPYDTSFLFDKFLNFCRQVKDYGRATNTLQYPSMQPMRKIVVLGSGGLSIGQAGEFDYSGSQAIKAYKEENVETVLINPNIATIQTAKGLADKVYYLPVTPDFVAEVIRKERPDGLSLSFGGQTALNCGVELYTRGLLAEYDVKVMGTSVETIMATEDRELFNNKMGEIKQPVANSEATVSVEEAVAAAERIGYPVMCRAAYALGGLGSGFCDNEEELRELAAKAFTASPQLLVEADMRGWKEVEYEVVRDANDNCITVCNMENFDPMGFHTGESIVIAPSQTLSNDEYHLLRDAAIKVVRHLGIIGECNVQYTLDPNSERYSIIEVNPRLSRSSALASKATGYPLAFVAAKLGLGVDLPQIQNSVTRSTSACFEPSLDYCVTKVPRWDLRKFERVSNHIGSAMKSVGEVMSIGRNFEESVQKALRMVNDSNPGFERGRFPTPGAKNDAERLEMIKTELKKPTDMRIFAIADAMYDFNMTVDEIWEITRIDKWFLEKLQTIVLTGNEVQELGSLDKLREDRELMKAAKVVGYSDKQIAQRVGEDSHLTVREARKEMGITPIVKQIDTLAAEFPAMTNYLFMTYSGQEHDIDFNEHGTLVLGSGVYRIGSSVEFDYCSVECIRALNDFGRKTVMLNYNPETVSTDYDESDRLYFEEITEERVLDIYEAEGCEAAIVSVGGQAPNNIALNLHNAGVKILGTHPEMIDRCEDRNKYSSMLDEIGVKQPAWSALKSLEDAHKFCDDHGYPVLVRPSYVLSGAAMNVAYNREELDAFLGEAVDVSPDHPVVMTKFLHGAIEVDVDGVAEDGEIKAYAISEHVEKGGTHSGDATLVLPAHTLDKKTMAAIKSDTQKIAKSLEITGPFNTQFLVKDDWIGVIETNLRASRSVPFVSKILDVPFVRMATKAMLNKDNEFSERLRSADVCDHAHDLKHVGVKSPQFSFKRLLGADPRLGVEMSSTGEVACLGRTVSEGFLKSLISAGFRPPRRGDTIHITAPERDTKDFLSVASKLDKLGYNLIAGDEHTSALLGKKHIKSSLDTSIDGKEHGTIRGREVDMVLELSGEADKYSTRRTATDFSISLMTDMEQAKLLVNALEEDPQLEISAHDDYFGASYFESADRFVDPEA